MKKVNITVLLLTPMAIGLVLYLGATAYTKNIGTDITQISWPYQSNESFPINEEGYRLKAETDYDKTKILDYGNELIWYITYPSGVSRDVAQIIEKDNEYYLMVKSIGEIDVTCANEKKTIEKTFHAYLVEKSKDEEYSNLNENNKIASCDDINLYLSARRKKL